MGRDATKSMKITESCHARVWDHKRPGENLSGAIQRAFDALEREDELPDAVAEVLRDDG